MLNPQNERIVIVAVSDGEIEMDSQGRFWRLRKRTWDRWNQCTRSLPCKRVRAEMRNKQGYLQIRVMWDKRRIYASAHRLVWHLTNGPIPKGMTINHKNGIKTDNRPENLELATMSEQRIHAIEVLNVDRNRPKGSKHPKTKLTEKDILVIRSRRTNGEMLKDIASDYDMKAKAIGAIVNRRTWRHV